MTAQKRYERWILCTLLCILLMALAACDTLETGITPSDASSGASPGTSTHIAAPTTLSNTPNTAGATPPPTSQPNPTADVSGWGTYTHHTFGVSFRYPAGWLPTAAESDGTRFAGEEGFFHIGAMGGDSLDEVVASEAGHTLQPYGSQPSVERLQVAGQEARLILPADDQPAGTADQAALIVHYPHPRDLSQQPAEYEYVVPGVGGGGSGISDVPGLAGETYAFFVLWADKTHIRAIAPTVQFIDDVTPGLTLTGTVLDVSLSARIITLQKPVRGFSVVALTKESMLLSADGNAITLRDLQRGATIQASGQPGESQALIASQVRVLDATPTPYALQAPIIPRVPMMTSGSRPAAAQPAGTWRWVSTSNIRRPMGRS